MITMPAETSISPFRLSIPQAVLDDLQLRLRLTRWPDKEPVSDWSQGVPLAAIQTLCEYWQTEYDWRRCEDLLNSLPQYTTTIDGVEIYFLHLRSSHEDALPLLVTHGWPGSILEFRHVIPKLIDPESHGGSSQDAFHLVIPALPGYAFSGKPTETGWNYQRTARAWAVLMARLGYADREWVAQGGDWGSHVTSSLGHQAPKGLRAVHMNSVYFEPKVSRDVVLVRNMVDGTLTRITERSSGASPRHGRRATSDAPGPPSGHHRIPWILITAVDQAPDSRVWAGGLTGRTGELDLREVQRLVPPRRKCRDGIQQGRDARHHHAVLALKLRNVFGPLLLGEQARHDRVAD